MDGLDSAFDKLRRADEHLESLYRQTREWIDSRPYSFYAVEVPVFDPDEPFHFKVHVLSVERPPWDLGVIFGDCVSNLRGALDHLFWEFVMRRKTADPDWREAREISFPIVTSSLATFLERPGIRSFRQRPSGMNRVEWAREIRRDRPGRNRVTYRERLWLQTFQPYRRGNAANAHPLAVLRDFNDRDKHRSIHPLLVAVSEPGPRFRVERGSLESSTLRDGQPLEQDAHIADVWVRSSDPNPQVDVELISVQIAFGARPRLRLRELPALREEVGTVLAAAVALF